MALVLRKSIGSFSAGTVVELAKEDIDDGGRYYVETPTGYILGRVHANDLVELRSRTDTVPVKNRKVRRRENRFALLQILKIKGETNADSATKES